MELEKEVRYTVNDAIWNAVYENTTPLIEKTHVLDITCGAFGRDSLAKTGRVFRVRQKPGKVALEIKKRTDNNDWIEEAIKLESVEQGINFLHLAGLDPYLYIDRQREVRQYKGLKIFFDDIELLGKFIEIEYQDSPSAETELKEFIEKFNIVDEPQPLYGTIINDRFENDPEFRAVFSAKLESLIK